MKCLVRANRPRQFATTSRHLGRMPRGKYEWGPSSNPLIHDKLDASKLKMISANQLATCRSPPKGVKALVRDFIHDALYNPFYGYFSHRAVIYSAPEPLAFTEMHSSSEFDEAMARVYNDISGATQTPVSTVGIQLWHTPVEIFQVCLFLSLCGCIVPDDTV